LHSNRDKRLGTLESKAAQRRDLLSHADSAKERILARLAVISNRLRAEGVVVELSANEEAQRMARVKASIQSSLKENRGG